MIKIFLLLLLSISLWATIGNVVAIKGDAQIKRFDKRLDVLTGMFIEQKDKILTASASRVQVIMKDLTTITIGADSSFSFQEYSFDGSSNSKSIFKAHRGFFRSVTGKIGELAPARFKVITPSATIGIRGTDFSADIGIEITTIRCHSGSISIDYENQEILLDAGMMLEIADKKEPLMRKISYTQSGHKKSSLNSFKIVEREKDKVEVNIEDIADVTHQEESIVQEPYEIDVDFEDREVSYDL